MVHEHDVTDHAHHHDVVLVHDHAERRTRWVVGLTLVMMVAELIAGAVSGSMALLADGAHMATHAGALALALVAYWYARTRARSEAYSFGTGKVNALAGYTSGVILGVVAIWMIVESSLRLAEHPDVAFGEALPVAAVGLVVNVISMVLLRGEHHHDDHDHDHHDHHHDHNLRAAYMHMLADALTSVLAIVALLAGRYAGWWFLDPAMGIVGGVLVIRWAIGLCRDASRLLLDTVPSRALADKIAKRLEAIDDVRVADLHLWEIAPGKQGCIVSLVTAEPRDVEFYRGSILEEVAVAHLTVEVHRCSRGHA